MADEGVKTEEFKFDVNTVIFMMYLLYKCNMLSRLNIRQMFGIIKAKIPLDLMKYLVEEEQKSI